MLSEEEKKAIDKLKKIREDTIKANECGLSNNDFKEEIEVYNVVLNLITKLQKENEELKKALNVVEKEKGQWIEENEEKDKQIELMIEEYEYNARINFKNFCEDELRKDKCIQDCKICARKYFETKAKKGE